MSTPKSLGGLTTYCMCLNMSYANCLEGSHKGLSLLYVFYICPHANLYDVLTVCVLYRSAPKTPGGTRYCICLNMFYSNRLEGSHKGLSSLYVFYIDIHPSLWQDLHKGISTVCVYIGNSHIASCILYRSSRKPLGLPHCTCLI